MKKLSELYDCNLDIEIKDIKINSKEIKRGDMFVCIEGITKDRHDFIDEAVKNGCSCLIVKKEGNYQVPFIKVDNPNEELAIVSKKFYDDPLKKIKLIGITGTDGKTTTASIIRNMLDNNKCGYIGTNGVYIKDKILKEENTTPSINKTYKYLNEFVSQDLEYGAMEISSEALLLNRTNTLELDVAIVTNITQDHLNVHKSIENYVESKKKIFSLVKDNGVVILNSDDLHYEELIKDLNKKVLTFGKNINSDLVIIDIKEFETGTIFTFGYNEEIYKVISLLKAEFNVYNLCSAILTLIFLGIDVKDAIKRVMQIESVDGRCEFLEYGQDYKIVLDYAHTPNGLLNILTYLNKIKKGKIITVTGSAGGREKEKRKEMGSIVLELSDYVIFTMDDPRNENVDEIINDLISDSKKDNYTRIIDRKKAIEEALSIAKKDDIILIAGKGKDSYMAIGNKKIEYSDFNVIDDYFKI